MNAFTTRETTTFYVKVLDQQLEAALEPFGSILSFAVRVQGG